MTSPTICDKVVLCGWFFNFRIGGDIMKRTVKTKEELIKYFKENGYTKDKKFNSWFHPKGFFFAHEMFKMAGKTFDFFHDTNDSEFPYVYITKDDIFGFHEEWLKTL